MRVILHPEDSFSNAELLEFTNNVECDNIIAVNSSTTFNYLAEVDVVVVIGGYGWLKRNLFRENKALGELIFKVFDMKRNIIGVSQGILPIAYALRNVPNLKVTSPDLFEEHEFSEKTLPIMKKLAIVTASPEPFRPFVVIWNNVISAKNTVSIPATIEHAIRKKVLEKVTLASSSNSNQ